MTTKMRKCVSGSALFAGSVLAAAIANAGPVGFASMNGGTTGGEGGPTVYATTGTEIHQALCSRPSNDSPIIIHVEGTINHGNTSKVSGSCNTADDKIEIKDISNVSIIGVGSGAVFDELGIHLRNTSNIILQNLHVRNVKKSGSPTSNGGDAIGMESNVSNIWGDHLTLEASGGEDEGYDGLFDMKNNTKYVTLSYSVLMNSGRGGLIGSGSGDDENDFITMHHNVYQNIHSRTPLLRFGTAHAFNNLYTGLTGSGINSRRGAEIKVEHNYFENSRNPLGSFYDSVMGYWEVNGNIWSNITWQPQDDETPAGPNPVSTTSVSIPYSYTLDDASCVPQIVEAYAGANKGLLTSDGSCAVSSSSSSSSSSSVSSSSSSSSSSSESSSSSSSSTSGEPGELGPNLALGAGADGSSKGDGSYGNVTDGDLSSYWQPASTSGERVGVKNIGATFNTVIIRELNNATTSWRLTDHDTGEVLASGTTLGAERVITGFGDRNLYKVNLEIDSASSAPQIAEFEVYHASGDVTSSSSSSSESSSSESSSESSSSESSSSSSSSAPATATLTIQENQAGFCYVDGTVDSDNGGFTGSGFANTENATGRSVGYSIEVPESGTYTLAIRYANGSSDRPADVLINGGSQGTLSMPGTGSWTSWVETGFTVNLNAGYNTLDLQATTSGGLANVDWSSVTGAEPVAGDCNGGTTSSSSSSSSESSSSSSSSESSSSESSSSSSEPADLGSNLALGAGADGSSKGDGSYGNVTDGSLSSYWQPASTSGERVGVKNIGATFNTVIIRELNNATTSWRLTDHDTGEVLASGSTLGAERVITGFGDRNLYKVNLMIDSASSAPQIAEFEVYYATGDVSSSSSSSSSSDGSGSSSSDDSSSSSSTSSSSSSQSSSSSSSTAYPDYSGPISNDCYNLATDPTVNWYETSLQTDQEIVQCLAQTLGRAVGYGENALGGYDPNGNSNLVVITKSSGVSVEQQILDAISTEAHNWIVFDKDEFAQETEVAMYRTHCSNPDVLSDLGATEAECIDYQQWCSNRGISGEAACLDEFFNEALNNKSLPIRNPVIQSNTTIDGRGADTYFRFSGFAIGKDSSGQPTQTANSVIITHNEFRGAGHTEDHGLDPDMLRSTGASHDIWIHKNTFDTTGDSAFDVKVGAYDITMSFNKVLNVKRASLHGSSDSREINEQITTTMHHNAFVTTDDQYHNLGNTGRRVPLIRRGTSHMFNNVFVNYRKDILSVRVGADLLWEDNMVVVNQALQEKDDVANALSELQSNLTRDVDGGNYRADGVFLWFADGACNLNSSTQTPLADASGSVGDLSQNYTQASRDTIAAQQIGAGQDLADYVSATAGVDGQLPFNSPLAGDIHYVLGLGKVSCQ